MATFVTLPAEIHLAILENLAEENIDDLYSLILASKTHQEVLKAYWRPVLRNAGTTILPTRPELVWAALQAQCSAGNMHLDGDAAAGNELNAWSVSDPKHDIWSIEYAGDKMEALGALVRLDHDIEELMDSLSILSLSHRISPVPYYSLRAIGLDPVHEDIRHLSPFYHTRVDARAAVWLQEMMRFRNQNRDGGDLRSWYERWLREHGLVDTPGIESCLATLFHEAKKGGTCCAADRDRLRESEVYFEHLKRVEKEYAGARDLGRRIQRILHASFVEEKYESGVEFAEFRGLARRWRWPPTMRGAPCGALESDWDMQAPMATMDMHGYSVLRRVLTMEESEEGWRRVP